MTDEPQPNQGDNLQRPLGTAAVETEVPPNQENAQQPSTPTDELETGYDGEQPPPIEHPIGVNNPQVGQMAPSGPATGPTVTVAAIIHPTSENHDVPSTSSAGSLNLSEHCSASRTVLSQLCKPVKSQAKRRLTRKTERAEVLTSSPYKKTLEEKSKNTKMKRQRKTKNGGWKINQTAAKTPQSERRKLRRRRRMAMSCLW
ncbi:hypothetical protein HOLleu_01981 [Holothuria leucospilota]|uniref:Uncharacterized protein n=1 Tax=Holothuria leucospilota TaxID=206669 RepID=A0A9Q1CR03_HOLLE|nr:hypothetical protein HOLleu_01981 [Holothuria leucospilota]